jgi:hypothetical protein
LAIELAATVWANSGFSKHHNPKFLHFKHKAGEKVCFWGFGGVVLEIGVYVIGDLGVVN